MLVVVMVVVVVVVVVLSPSHEELIISLDTVLGRNSFVPPDRHLYALVLKQIYEYNFHPHW